MSTSAKPESSRKSGEAEAIAEIAATQSTRGARLLLTAVFLGVIGVIGVVNSVSLRSQWARLGSATAGSSAAGGESGTSLWARVQNWNDGVLVSLRGVEKAYDEKSPFCMSVQPVMQGVLSGLGEGSDEVIIGRDGWLIHRNAIRFMTRGENRHRHTPPVAAIAAFGDYLKSRDIRLVLLPVPPKLAIYPEFYGPALTPASMMPPVWADWKAKVEAAGVKVFDLRPVLTEARKTAAAPLYLKTDTHWTAEGMEIAAAALGRYLTAEGLVSAAAGDPPAVAAPVSITATGDLRRMLRLADSSALFPQETVAIHEVRTAGGLRWQNSEESEVLLMGDSFCNIFSQKSLGWGTGSGMAEHLGRVLGRPVSAILRNGDGAFATRAILARSLQSGNDRLKGRKVVIWEFDATQITEGEWKPFSYEVAPAAASQFLEVAAGGTEKLVGTVVSVSPVPVPGTVAYRDYLATVHLRDVHTADGQPAAGSELLAYGMAMKDNQWTPLAEVRPGEVLEITARAWSDVEAEYGPLSRAEPAGDLFLQPINWLDTLSVRSTNE